VIRQPTTPEPPPARLVLTGGGTSGHVNPALAMGQALEARLGRARMLYLGVKGRAEEVIVPKAGLPIGFVSAAPYASPRRPLAFARFVVTLGLGMLKAAAALWRFKPDYLLATGGFAAAPAVLSLALLKRLGLSKAKIIIHEANAVLGKFNRLMAGRADHLFLTFPASQTGLDRGRVSVVGYPVRGVLAALDRRAALERLGLELDQETKVVLVFGGSQGARTINRAVVEALGWLERAERPPFILHATGLGSADFKPWPETQALLGRLYGPDWPERFARLYRPEVYIHDMAAAYSAADLVICRAGAGAIHELSALGKPALLIPKPNLPGDHQVQNARALSLRGGAEVLHEDLLIRDGRLIEGLDGRDLAGRILELLADPERLASLSQNCRGFMASDAAERIAELILNPEVRASQAQPVRVLPPPPTHEGLLAMLNRARNGDPKGFDPAGLIPDPEELDYFRHRSALLLLRPAWQSRNVGVKLAGLLKDQTKIEPLILLLTDRRPVAGLARLLGGDFEQVGFIRRNCLTSLMLIDRLTPELEGALVQALADPYYEVRSHAARAAAHFADRLARPEEFQRLLEAGLGDKNFEVAREAALALGRVGRDDSATRALLGLRLHRFWQVREAALQALRQLSDRGLVREPALLLDEVAGFVTTATDFAPHFAIKAAYQDLVQGLRRGKA